MTVLLFSYIAMTTTLFPSKLGVAYIPELSPSISAPAAVIVYTCHVLVTVLAVKKEGLSQAENIMEMDVPAGQALPAQKVLWTLIHITNGAVELEKIKEHVKVRPVFPS